MTIDHLLKVSQKQLTKNVHPDTIESMGFTKSDILRETRENKDLSTLNEVAQDKLFFRVDMDQHCVESATLSHPITHLLLCLGSNHRPKTYLPFAIQQLQKLGDIRLSKALTTADHTVKSERLNREIKLNLKTVNDYVNQCAIIQLINPCDVGQLAKIICMFKTIERQAHRGRLHDCPFDILTHYSQSYATQPCHHPKEVLCWWKSLRQDNKTNTFFWEKLQFYRYKRVSVDIDLLALKTRRSSKVIDVCGGMDDGETDWWIIERRYPFKPYEWVGVKELLTDVKSVESDI